jgi:hypothetical protein
MNDDLVLDATNPNDWIVRSKSMNLDQKLKKVQDDLLDLQRECIKHKMPNEIVMEINLALTEIQGHRAKIHELTKGGKS